MAYRVVAATSAPPIDRFNTVQSFGVPSIVSLAGIETSWRCWIRRLSGAGPPVELHSMRAAVRCAIGRRRRRPGNHPPSMDLNPGRAPTRAIGAPRVGATDAERRARPDRDPRRYGSLISM